MRNLIILNPSTITGLTDGDGSFYISISPSIKNLTGWSVSINFQIVANTNNANLEMLEKVKLFFGVGNISKNKLDNTVRYTVSGLKNCKVIQQQLTPKAEDVKTKESLGLCSVLLFGNTHDFHEDGLVIL